MTGDLVSTAYHVIITLIMHMLELMGVSIILFGAVRDERRVD